MARPWSCRLHAICYGDPQGIGAWGGVQRVLGSLDQQGLVLPNGSRGLSFPQAAGIGVGAVLTAGRGE